MKMTKKINLGDRKLRMIVLIVCLDAFSIVGTPVALYLPSPTIHKVTSRLACCCQATGEFLGKSVAVKLRILTP
jgi:hypothetical protein